MRFILIILRNDSESSSPTSRDTSPEEICLSCVKASLECEVREGCKACVACKRAHKACLWEDGSEVHALLSQSKAAKVRLRNRRGQEREDEDTENVQDKKRRKLNHRKDDDLLSSLKQGTKEIKKARHDINAQNGKQRGDTIRKLKGGAARLDSRLESFKGQLTPRKRGTKK